MAFFYPLDVYGWNIDRKMQVGKRPSESGDLITDAKRLIVRKGSDLGPNIIIDELPNRSLLFVHVDRNIAVFFKKIAQVMEADPWI